MPTNVAETNAAFCDMVEKPDRNVAPSTDAAM